jgi:hypothetical protein
MREPLAAARVQACTTRRDVLVAHQRGRNRHAARPLDFTTNYVMVCDIATASGSPCPFVVGPLVYLGHETAFGLFRRAPKP